MILISLILLTVSYYLLLWYLQRKRQADFQAAAIEVIGSTKPFELVFSDNTAIFGPTNISLEMEKTIQDFAPKKEISSKVAEQLERATLFEQTTLNDPAKITDQSKVVVQAIPHSTTDTETQQEAISNLKTKEELLHIANELDYDEASEEVVLTEENDLEQMMEEFGNFSGLYQQEVQEVIGNNTKHT